MKKLDKEQIEQIKKLYNEGKKIREIARIMNVYPNSIRYHISPEFREKLREINRKWYNKLSKEEKSEYFRKKREYQKEYQRNRYKNDSKFREKQLERAKKYQKGNYNKK